MWSPHGWLGWAFVCVTIIFFNFVNHICNRFVDVHPGVYRGYRDKYRVFRWRNLFVSMIHSTITGCWSLGGVILYWKSMSADMIEFINWPMYLMCCFAAGYFIYDLLDIVVVKRMLQKWEIIIHHIALLIISSFVVTYAKGVGYQTVGLLVEVNTIFLHRRQLFHLANQTSKTDRLVRANIYANIFTFVVFRMIPLVYLTYSIFVVGHRVPVWYYWFHVMSMIFLNTLNVGLFYRLVRADLFGVEKFDKRKKDENFSNPNSSKEIDGTMENSHKNGLRLRENVNHMMKHS